MAKSLKSLEKMTDKERGDYLANIRGVIEELKSEEERCVDAASRGMVFEGYRFCLGGERMSWKDEEKAFKVLKSIVENMESVMKLCTPTQVIKIQGEVIKPAIEKLIETKTAAPCLRVASA